MTRDRGREPEDDRVRTHACRGKGHGEEPRGSGAALSMAWAAIPLMLGTLAGGPDARAAEIYRWTDAQGVPHYANRPRPGAERVELDPISVVDPGRDAGPPVLDSAPPPGARDPAPPARGADVRLRIVQPADGETLWLDDRRLQVVTAVEPPPAQGRNLRIAVFIDGERRAVAPSGAARHRLVIEDVDRGTRALHAELIDARGQVVAGSGQSTVYVKQHHR